MNPILDFKAVTKHYPSGPVTHELAFSLNPGESCALFGPSGVGKTTILKLAAGLVKPDAGEVILSTKRIGYVFQEPRMLPWRTVLDNVVIPLLAADFDAVHATDMATCWLETMGLADVLTSYPSGLSGGMVQRVALARAFAIEPELLLLDEPFSALDLSLRSSMIDLTRKLIDDRSIALLYVSHIPEEALSLTRRFLLLSPGGQARELPSDNRAELLGNITL